MSVSITIVVIYCNRMHPSKIKDLETLSVSGGVATSYLPRTSFSNCLYYDVWSVLHCSVH
jgi:hypothetical protein